MKRGYTSLEYKQKIRKLREVRTDISLSTDIIVGFPGETERDFEATMALVQEIGFDQSYSFVYSARPGTPAAALPDDISKEEKLDSSEPTAGTNQQTSAGHQRGDGRHGSAGAGGKAVIAERSGGGRQNRKQPLG